MANQQPIVTGAGPRHRQFVTSAIAVQAIIVNPTKQVLLLSSPIRSQGWQVVSGALEMGETLVDGTLREIYEELGADIKVRPLGTVHAETFHYDDRVQYVLSTYYLFAYQGGNIKPSDDMVGSEFRWWSLDKFDEELHLHRSTRPWILNRAVAVYRLWSQETELPLQSSL